MNNERYAVVVLNGFTQSDSKTLEKLLSSQCDLFACDGGANLLYQMKQIPKLILGDLDSIKSGVLTWFKSKGVEIEQFSPIKDNSDAELIFAKLSAKYDKIWVVGAVGKRFDHSLVNLFLLEKFPKLHYVSECEEIFLVDKKEELLGLLGRTVSILPLTSEVVVTLRGFEYPLTKGVLHRSSSKGLSNVVSHIRAEIEVEEGKVIVIACAEECI